jgi:sugar phosphate isomerase/epimerase
MFSERRPIAQIIKEHAPWLAHFHANDPNLLGPGFGDEDFAPILASLHEIDYGGFVSVEVFDFSPGPEAIARESLRYLENLRAE